MAAEYTWDGFHAQRRSARMEPEPHSTRTDTASIITQVFGLRMPDGDDATVACAHMMLQRSQPWISHRSRMFNERALTGAHQSIPRCRGLGHALQWLLTVEAWSYAEQRGTVVGGIPAGGAEIVELRMARWAASLALPVEWKDA